jgi:protein ImuA
MEHREPDPRSSPLQARAPEQVILALQEQITRLEGARMPGGEALISSGCEALDRRLPHRGFRRGTLVEWLGVEPGSGTETLAFYAAREACRAGGTLVVLDRRREFYPPAAVRLGIEPQAMIVVHALSETDHLWALDQSLRCPSVAAVVAWPERLDGRSFRRLQLAIEQGGGLGLLVRSARARHEPSWADVRLLVEPAPAASPEGWRRLRVEVLRSRGGMSGERVELEVNDETRTVHLASRLAHPADHRRATGA